MANPSDGIVHNATPSPNTTTTSSMATPTTTTSPAVVLHRNSTPTKTYPFQGEGGVMGGSLVLSPIITPTTTQGRGDNYNENHHHHHRHHHSPMNNNNYIINKNCFNQNQATLRKKKGKPQQQSKKKIKFVSTSSFPTSPTPTSWTRLPRNRMVTRQAAAATANAGGGRTSSSPHSSSTSIDMDDTSTIPQGGGSSRNHHNYHHHHQPHDLVTYSFCCGEPFEIRAISGYNGMIDDPSLSGRPPSPSSFCAVVYTTHLSQPRGHHLRGGVPELIAFDVPMEKIRQICNLFIFLVNQMEGHRFVRAGEIVESDGLVLETCWIIDPIIRQRLQQRFQFQHWDWMDPMMMNPPPTTTSARRSHSTNTAMGGSGTSTGSPRGSTCRPHHSLSYVGGGINGPPSSSSTIKVLHLKPRFPLEDNQLKNYGPDFVGVMWGCRPAAPGGQTSLRDTIVDIFTTKLIIPSRFLTWYIDGNPTNNGLTNLQAVSLGEALSNPTWYVDWCRFLDDDPEMISYVRTHSKHFANLFRIRYGSKIFTELDYNRIRFQYLPPQRLSRHVVLPSSSPITTTTTTTATPLPLTPSSHDSGTSNNNNVPNHDLYYHEPNSNIDSLCSPLTSGKKNKKKSIMEDHDTPTSTTRTTTSSPTNETTVTDSTSTSKSDGRGSSPTTMTHHPNSTSLSSLVSPESQSYKEECVEEEEEEAMDHESSSISKTEKEESSSSSITCGIDQKPSSVQQMDLDISST